MKRAKKDDKMRTESTQQRRGSTEKFCSFSRRIYAKIAEHFQKIFRLKMLKWDFKLGLSYLPDFDIRATVQGRVGGRCRLVARAIVTRQAITK